MIWLALVVIGVLFILHWHFKTREFRRKISKLKCEPYIPLLGHILKLGTDSTDLLDSIERMWHSVGRDVFLLKLGPLDQIIVTYPDDVEVILSSSTLLKKSVLYDISKAWLGEGLLNSDGTKWRTHRKLLTPAFHFKVLESYVDLYKNEANAFVENILQQQYQDLETLDLVGSGNIKSLARSALGGSFCSEEGISTFRHNTQGLLAIISHKIFSVWKRVNFLFSFTNEHREFEKLRNELNSIILEISNKKREELKDVIEAISSGKTTIEEITTGDNEFTKRKLTFIEILLLSRKPDGEPLTTEEIDDEVNTFIVAGFETTTKAICFTMYLLAKYPDIQDKVFQEQLEITNGDLSQPITYADLQNMKYLERVIKETLRFYPTAPFFGREITKNTILKDGTELPEGCSVLIFPYLTHRNPDLFRDPLKFDPDRFLEPINTYSYYPFSAGPRNCIGQKLALMSLRTWLATIVRSCIIYPSKNKDIKLAVEITLTSTTGIHLQFKKR